MADHRDQVVGEEGIPPLSVGREPGRMLVGDDDEAARLPERFVSHHDRSLGRLAPLWVAGVPYVGRVAKEKVGALGMPVLLLLKQAAQLLLKRYLRSDGRRHRSSPSLDGDPEVGEQQVVVLWPVEPILDDGARPEVVLRDPQGGGTSMERRERLGRDVGRGCDEDSVGSALRVGHELVDDFHDRLGMEALVALALDPPFADVTFGEDLVTLAALVFFVALRTGSDDGDLLRSHVDALVATEPPRWLDDPPRPEAVHELPYEVLEPPRVEVLHVERIDCTGRRRNVASRSRLRSLLRRSFRHPALRQYPRPRCRRRASRVGCTRVRPSRCGEASAA